MGLCGAAIYVLLQSAWSKSYGEMGANLIVISYAMSNKRVWGSRVKWRSRAGMEDGVELTFIMCWWI